MSDERKTKAQLIEEVRGLRQRLARLESEAAAGGAGRLERLNEVLRAEIADRRRAEEALRESETKFRILFHEATDTIGLHEITPEGLPGCFVEVNDHACRSSGYTREELLRMTPLDLSDPGREFPAESVRRQVRQHGCATFEVSARTKDGRTFPSEVRSRALVWRGRPVILSIARDVSERKRLEAQFLQAQKMEGIGRLAGGMAHDFSNLVTAMAGYATLARDELPEGSPARDDIEQVLDAAARATDLAGKLLAFSRRQALSAETVDVNGLVGGVSRLLRRLIGEDVELSVRPDPAAGAVRVDPGQIEQALINLAVNARDAMPGGGKLTVTVGRRRVREEEGDADVDLPAGDYATIEFRDTGTGISEEARRHLFEPFFTTKGPGRGTGLGLATAYGIVRQHGGTLVADPPAAGGAVFRMFLPAAAGEERPAPETPDRGEVRRGGETVLVVEDDRSVRRLEVLILRGLGYRVLEASGPEEALRLSRETDGAIDVLASDLVMPRMGGLELAEKIRAERPGIRVLLVSGYGEETVDGGRTRTARQRFLEKPFTEQTLGGALRELLDER